MTEGNYNIDSDSATEDQSLFDYFDESGALDELDMVEGVDPREYRWHEGTRYERDVQEARTKQRQREYGETTRQAVRDAISEANPQGQIERDYGLMKKYASKKDAAVLSVGEGLHREKAHFEKEMAQAEKLGDQQRYDRAAWHLREVEAKLEDQPQLEVQEKFERDTALAHLVGLAEKYHGASPEQKKELFPDLKDSVVTINKTSSEPFLYACDEKGETYRVPTPLGLPAHQVFRELTEERDNGPDGRLEGFADYELVHAAASRGIKLRNNDLRKFGGSSKKSKDADEWITHDVHGKPLRKPMKKAKLASGKRPEPSKDIETVTARPGDDHLVEEFDVEETKETSSRGSVKLNPRIFGI